MSEFIEAQVQIWREGQSPTGRIQIVLNPNKLHWLIEIRDKEEAQRLVAALQAIIDRLDDPHPILGDEPSRYLKSITSPRKGPIAMTDQQQLVKVTGHQLPSNIG